MKVRTEPEGAAPDEVWEGSLADFERENEDLPELDDVRALEVGESTLAGGGAGILFTITRTA